MENNLKQDNRYIHLLCSCDSAGLDVKLPCVIELFGSVTCVVPTGHEQMETECILNVMS